MFWIRCVDAVRLGCGLNCCVTGLRSRVLFWMMAGEGGCWGRLKLGRMSCFSTREIIKVQSFLILYRYDFTRMMLEKNTTFR